MSLASVGEEVIVTRNGKDFVRMVSCNDTVVSEGSALYVSNALDSPGVSYEEFLQLTENSDLRYELIDGELFNLSSPSYNHQIIVGELHTIFNVWFKGKKCKPLTSPFDITLIKGNDNKNVVQPDIVVICDKENIDDKGKYMGVPKLVVEVLSRSTRRKDMLKKLDLYMQSGVAEYWIIDPDKEISYVYNFKENDIDEYSNYSIDDIIISNVFQGLEVRMGDLFAE
jgi:Uma2 family endonuclease